MWILPISFKLVLILQRLICWSVSMITKKQYKPAPHSETYLQLNKLKYSSSKNNSVALKLTLLPTRRSLISSNAKLIRMQSQMKSSANNQELVKSNLFINRISYNSSKIKTKLISTKLCHLNKLLSLNLNKLEHKLNNINCSQKSKISYQISKSERQIKRAELPVKQRPFYKFSKRKSTNYRQNQLNNGICCPSLCNNMNWCKQKSENSKL